MRDTNETNPSADVAAKTVLWQLIKEFTIPAAITVAWVVWDGRGQPRYDYVGKFFLLVMSFSYIFLQWHRVRKQLRAERGMSVLEQGMQTMLTRMEATTEDMIGYATGGSSYCWLEASRVHLLTQEFVVQHHGKYPMRDVQVRIVDLDRLDDPKIGHAALTENTFKLDLLLPGHVQMIKLKSRDQLDRRHELRYNVFITAPNGSFNQMLRQVIVDGVLRKAVLLEGMFNDTFMEEVDPEFPRDLDGNVNWDDHEYSKKPSQAPAHEK